MKFFEHLLGYTTEAEARIPIAKQPERGITSMWPPSDTDEVKEGRTGDEAPGIRRWLGGSALILAWTGTALAAPALIGRIDDKTDGWPNCPKERVLISVQTGDTLLAIGYEVNASDGDPNDQSSNDIVRLIRKENSLPTENDVQAGQIISIPLSC